VLCSINPGSALDRNLSDSWLKWSARAGWRVVSAMLLSRHPAGTILASCQHGDRPCHSTRDLKRKKNHCGWHGILVAMSISQEEPPTRCCGQHLWIGIDGWWKSWSWLQLLGAAPNLAPCLISFTADTHHPGAYFFANVIPLMLESTRHRCLTCWYSMCLTVPVNLSRLDRSAVKNSLRSIPKE
jgi:hypothetical protein